MNSGIIAATLAYLLWGLFPLYFRLLQSVPALELVAHRILWSFLLLILVLTIKRQWKSFWDVFHQKRIIFFHLASSITIASNWLIYVWAINTNRVIESSMGYFLNPLLTIVLGVIIFKERLRTIQWISVGLAAVGISILSCLHGTIPWVALSLALSFGLYGLLKKLAPVQTTFGLLLETSLLILPASGYLIYGVHSDQSTWILAPARTHFLLIGTGLVTIIPLFLFAVAAVRIPLSQLGFLQYLTPTMQFLLGYFLYHESFNTARQISFTCIWIALALNWIPHKKHNYAQTIE